MSLDRVTKEHRVESVERALSILEAFSDRRRNLALSELADETGLYKSTILRLASSLERYGYLRRDDASRFRLGPSLWRLGSIYRQDFGLGEHIRPVLRRLVTATGETASFYVLEMDERLCLYRENSPNSVRHHLEEGSRLSLDRGAAGHVLRAYGAGSGNAQQLLRPDGGCISVGERNPDIAAVAAPVHDRDGALHGALAVSGLRSRFDAERRTHALELVLEACRELGTVA
ncbi:IclR family transcriptional regulator [Pararhizobium mangrovi]|uniref:IclR family transcriptional regulator n=1 Tax=Pararhizobium mangrovi TaxID=2590452 RepID=A0A506TZ35_9HYPH|nr:IclR family transcriptional regulator [Pararhizobium mangrovi]TPW26251.1 IclR family transcriptional regulator [Pararhizobium mangrovi]